MFFLLCACVCVCMCSISFRYVSWNQGDYNLHMITEYDRTIATGVLSDSGNSISATSAGEPLGLAVSPDGAQLYILSDAHQSINWYVFLLFVLSFAAHTTGSNEV